MPTHRVAVYCRVSTAEQSTDMQISELREQAKHRGWEVVGEYLDVGVSGAKSSRPQLDALMADARRRRFDTVAVWRFDRFARSVSHLLGALEEFRALGIDFVSIRESVDTSTPMGKMIFVVISGVAELERALIRERVQAGVDRARAKGKRLGRPPLEIDAAKAKALRAQGKSMRQIASILRTSPTKVFKVLRDAGDGVLKSPSRSML